MGFFSKVGGFLKDTAGSLIGGAADVVGGVLGLSGTKDTNAISAALTREQIAYQKELAKNQIQWRVEDAKKAGLHPMASLGLSPSSFSPVSTSLSTPDYNFLSDFGQNADRAIMQGKTAPERKKALELQETQASLSIRNQELQNDLLETELADKRFRLQQQIFPPTPPVNSPDGLIPGQTGSIIVTPSEVKSAEFRGTQAGAPPSVQWFSNPDGSVTRSMSEQAKSANEDDIINTIGWHIDNNLIPFSHRFGGAVHVNPANFAPPLKYLPKGAVGWLPDGINRFVPVYDWYVPGAFYGEDS